MGFETKRNPYAEGTATRRLEGETTFLKEINNIAICLLAAKAPERETFFRMVFLTDVDIIKICGTKTTMMYIRNTSPGFKPDYWMTNTLMLNAGENMP